MRRIRARLPLTAVLLLGLAVRAAAQTPADPRAAYHIAIPQWLEWYEAALRSAPGAGASSPAAYGASYGDFFAGAGYQARVRQGPRQDGAVVGGFGLGSASRSLGLEVAITSVSTLRTGFGERMTASFKAHRSLPHLAALALGVENGLRTSGTDGGRSVYAVASKVFPLNPDAGAPFSAVTASVGVGDGRFRSISAVRQNRSTVGVFGSVAVRVLPAASLVGDWNGQDLTAAVSLAPFPHLPIVITPSFADLLGRSGGNRARFSLGVGGGVHVDL